jgi:hypothetical protein
VISAAKTLHGKRHLLASTENDEVNLQLDGALLNIFNPVTLRGTTQSLSALVGRSVEAVDETPQLPRDPFHWRCCASDRPS